MIEKTHTQKSLKKIYINSTFILENSRDNKKKSEKDAMNFKIVKYKTKPKDYSYTKFLKESLKILNKFIIFFYL